MAKVIPNAAAPAQQSSKPGTKAPEGGKKKKEKTPRIFHPALQAAPVLDEAQKPKLNKKGKEIVRPSVQLESIPADYDIKKHKPLTRGDFKDESLFFELKAQYFDKKAAECRSQATLVKQLGNADDRKAAKKLLDLQKRIAELTEGLKKSGVDVTALENKIKADLEKKAAEPTPAQA